MTLSQILLQRAVYGPHTTAANGWSHCVPQAWCFVTTGSQVVRFGAILPATFLVLLSRFRAIALEV